MWGCLAKVQVPLPKRTKLGLKMIDCVFIGYALHSAAYRFLVIKYEIPDINNNTIMESIEIEFIENIFPLRNKTTMTVDPRGSMRQALLKVKLVWRLRLNLEGAKELRKLLHLDRIS